MGKAFVRCWYLWDKMLTDAREFYAAADLQYIPTSAHYKKEASFLKEVVSQSLLPFTRICGRRIWTSSVHPARLVPQFKIKKVEKDSFTAYCREYRTGPSIRLTGSGLQMPKLGVIEVVIHRSPQAGWTLVPVIVSKSGSRKYDASIAFKYPVRQAEPVRPSPERTLGLRYSFSCFYVDSK